ncbi:LOW QUALITY PROTEIN: putative RNA polymerase II subunit B1 CTD phosphatase Rpap2 [Nylanderia fulva]|uniref:LOW QUALITY PROTEIN: putative RNA polymerase II subunit B1 CTD phosphatase Rpap2 n=1 Tax=Nylanderia fulva TaxID=613905 RepID=UPI0010FB5B7A|nr:LOW QUALITY PROTEIN: putative RNA polymerase II subunit B1 CTD phosphatase Rpap2 [Nylanderia fulva]
MSAIKKSAKQKIKKMSKAQMQLAIIKKKQCDAKALAIVEQLLEPNVNTEWLLQNLRFISKSHMEDVIEERAIIKLCGYILCSKPLTVIIRQQYHISTHRNKVYDISKRKNFCSSLCYGAANYLLEQMLESPLWLREIDDIPTFQILPKSKQFMPGDEVKIDDINLSQNINADNTVDSEESTKHNIDQQAKEDISSSPEKKIYSSHLSNDVINDDNVKEKEIPVNSNSQKMGTYSLDLNQEKKDYNYSEESTECNKNNCNSIEKINIDLQNLEMKVAEQSENILHLHEYNSRDAENKNTHVSSTSNDSTTLQSQVDEIINKNDCNEMLQPSSEISCDQKDANKRLQFQSDKISSKTNEKLQSQSNEINNSDNNDRKIKEPQLEICNNDTTVSSKFYNEHRKKRDTDRIKKSKEYKQKKSDNVGTQANIYHNLVMHVEQSVKEWVTENTLCLLMGEMDEKRQLLESLTQHDRYQQLCKKLNRLQLEDEKEERAHLEKNVLKPLPHFSVLQEEAKKIDVKVRAFYKGQMTMTSPKDNKESESKDDDNSVLPLTDAHAPNALRRRIFLDKLNKILPDLMRALTTNADTSSMARCTYDHERYSLIKILISTFNLSAANIIFKTAEWTLVGLIMIKMLSLIDEPLQALLQSKQASMYTSMILMTYKLDSSYLDRLIMEVTNTVNTSE